MISIEQAAEAIHDKILNIYQSGFEMRDENRKTTTDPQQARYFSFPFIKGDSFTVVTVSISDGS
ncbi:MAG: hypothetical protein RLZZ196_227, partial [Bacteroidota bacterium]